MNATGTRTPPGTSRRLGGQVGRPQMRRPVRRTAVRTVGEASTRPPSTRYRQVLPERHRFWRPERYDTGDTPAYRRTYYRMLAEAAETGLFDCLSHPDLVKYIDHTEWNFDFYAHVIEESLDRIATTGTCMELNTAGHLMSLREYSPGSGAFRSCWAPMLMSPAAWATTSRKRWTCCRTSAFAPCPSFWIGNVGTWTSNWSTGRCTDPRLGIGRPGFGPVQTREPQLRP